jgi:hypothetical protein
MLSDAFSYYYGWVMHFLIIMLSVIHYAESRYAK